MDTKKYLVKDCEDERILRLSEALRKEQAIGVFADVYYNEGGNDFFKLTKGEESITQIIYIDVDEDGYSVHGFYGHEHSGSLDATMQLVKGLYEGKIAESAFVMPAFSACSFIRNEFDMEKNIDVFLDSVAFWLNKENSTVINFLQSMPGHLHIASPWGYSIKWEAGQNTLFEGAKNYYVRYGVMGTESDDVFLG